jgi:antitoxin (DNA-binding transcriptional repressor) of toxin-antitoxin stability system
MKTMELFEVRDRLEELMIWVSRGEEIVLTDAGKWVALLSPPPDRPTPEREAEATAAAEEAVRGLVRGRVTQGIVFDEGSPLSQFVDPPK